MQEKLCRIIRAGNYAETAAAACGINRDTLREWIKRGAREGAGRYHDLAVAIDEASGHAEVRAVAIIGKAAETQWQAAAWMLERKHPDRWGKRISVQAQNAMAQEEQPQPTAPWLEQVAAE
jgi:hypothetical protein